MNTVEKFPLSAEVRVFNELRRRLAEDFGLDENDEAVLDTADGLSSLSDMLIHMLRQAREKEAQAEACKGMAKQMAERASRIADGASKIRGIVSWAMEEARLVKLTAPDLSASLAAGAPSVAVLNEELVPDEFCRIKTIREPDKLAIKKHLQGGGHMAGAMLNNARPVLRVNSK